MNHDQPIGRLPPRPLLLSTFDDHGGAGRAARRLHLALLAAGVPSRLRVLRMLRAADGVSAHPTPVGRNLDRLRAVIDRILGRMGRSERQGLLHLALLPTGTGAMLRSRADYDLLHLHWICWGLLRPEDLRGITRPVVWTLHDMWPFTGGCHYDDGCGRYGSGCGHCPMLRRPGPGDGSARLMRRKMDAWRALDLTLVAPSRWLAREAARSALFAGRPVRVIPNALDLDIFYPMDRARARAQLGLPDDRRVVLFGAINPLSDPRKGGDLLQAALGQVSRDRRSAGLRVLIVGAPGGTSEGPGGIPVHSLGVLRDNEGLRQAYAAADVSVIPSRQENLANMIAESLGCGRPCIGFDIGGNGDLIRDGETGRLVRPFDIPELAQAILEVPETEGWVDRCRGLAERTIAAPVVAASHLALYDEILSRTGRAPAMAGQPATQASAGR